MNNQTNINTSALQNSITTFRQFREAVARHDIHPRRLAKFFDGFSDSLHAAGISFPDHESANGSYYASISAALASPERLPAPVRLALFTLETAAEMENHNRLDEALNRRIPNVSLTPCPIDRALELWFAAPDELAQFAPPAPAALEGPLPPAGASKSSPEHPAAALAPAALPLPRGEGGVRGNGCSDAPPSTINSPTLNSPSGLAVHSVEPWPEPVDGKLLLDTLAKELRRFVVLPIWAAETLALWIVHTFAFQLRDVSTYIGIESPEKQCGKTTLLTVISELANRAVAASNISPPAFFRVIEDLSPTLLIDEADTFLRGNEQLKGILNAGYKRKTGFVLRAGPSLNEELDTSTPASAAVVNCFSCWCPKLIAQIGHLPDTLADRCIVIRMQRKTRHEECERLRNLDAEPLKRQCARFVLDHQQQIAAARPEFPAGLSDRASDIWEPLLALADLAGGDWPQKARQAAVGLSAVAQESNPIGSLLVDIFVVFAATSEERLFTKSLVQLLINSSADRPWAELRQGKPITELWLSQKLRPYGIYPRTMRIGEARAKGYLLEDFKETFQRYLPKSELLALVAEAKATEAETGPKNSGP